MSQTKEIYRSLPRAPPLEDWYASNYLLWTAINQRVEIIPDALLNAISGDFTLEQWINPTSLDHVAFPAIVSKRDAGATYSYQLYYDLGTTEIRFLFRDALLAVHTIFDTQGIVPTLNIWQHFIVERIGNTFYAYMNLVQVGMEVDAAAMNVNTERVRYGCLGGDQLFNNWWGGITQMRIYNWGLTAEERENSFRRGYARFEPPGCVLNFRLNEGGGPTTYDDSPSVNNGSILPAATPPTWETLQKHQLLVESGQ